MELKTTRRRTFYDYSFIQAKTALYDFDEGCSSNLTSGVPTAAIACFTTSKCLHGLETRHQLVLPRPRASSVTHDTRNAVAYQSRAPYVPLG
jgi:hypothetical protein